MARLEERIKLLEEALQVSEDEEYMIIPSPSRNHLLYYPKEAFNNAEGLIEYKKLLEIRYFYKYYDGKNEKRISKRIRRLI
jgi:hypothetical protein